MVSTLPLELRYFSNSSGPGMVSLAPLLLLACTCIITEGVATSRDWQVEVISGVHGEAGCPDWEPSPPHGRRSPVVVIGGECSEVAGCICE